MTFKWIFSDQDIDWQTVSHLYRIAPLGDKPAKNLAIVFSNSLFKCFVYDQSTLVAVGRALADGVDCSYICDVAVHPDYQGLGLGRDVINHLREQSSEHKKIILYANPGKEGFYQKLGFKKMNTAMAIFKDAQYAQEIGLVEAS